MSASQLQVSFLGLGGMGSGIAKNIQKKGFPLVVWSRTASKADDLVKAGAKVAASAREAVANADVIGICLFDDKSCLDTAQGENGYLAGLKKGAIVVNTTTITPSAATELQKLHEQQGAHYVSATVLGRPDVAAAGQLRSFVAGHREAVERARPVIEAYSGGAIIVVGEDPAQGNVVKLTANMILAANISLFGQVYALNDKWGIDQDVTHQVITTFYSHPGLLAYENRVRKRDYDRVNGEGFGADGGLKDVKNMLAAGDQVGVSLPFCDVVKEQFTTLIEKGLKDKEWAVLGDATRDSAGSSSQAEKKQK